MSSAAARLCHAHLRAMGPGIDPSALAEVAWLGLQLARHGAAASDDAPLSYTEQKATGKPETGTASSAADTGRPPLGRSDGPRPERLVPLYPALDLQGAGTDRASLVSVPCGEALPQRLHLERALKPFKRRIASRRQRELDPLATAEASAEWQSITPVYRPKPERWFEVAILAETSDAMHVWDATLVELRRMLARHGAFRAVRLWRYAMRNGVLSLSTAGAAVASPRTLVDPQGRRMCWFVTTGTSPLWQHPEWTGLVAALGRCGPTVIVQLMPQHTWPYTLLGGACEEATAPIPGAPSAQLLLRDPFSGMLQRDPGGLTVPVTSLEPACLAAWARFAMAGPRTAQPAIRVQPVTEGCEAVDAPAPAASPRQRIAIFRTLASPAAFQLLRLLSGMPLTLPVMRLMQMGMRERAQVHLAEVLLSGLIERMTPPDADVAPDMVEYDFAPGIRDELHDSLSSGESGQIESVLSIIEQARHFVESQVGSANASFQALVRDMLGHEQLLSQAQSFLDVNSTFRGLPRTDPEPPDIATDAEFLSESDILQTTLHEIADPLWTGDRRCLLFFETVRQRSWLVASAHAVALVLDDGDTRRSGRRVQRHGHWLSMLPVRVEKTTSEEDIVYFGTGQESGWYYSQELFSSPRAMEEGVIAMVPGGWDGALMQARHLASEYDALRASLPYGDQRTAAMQSLVERMAIAPPLDHIDMVEASRHPSPGMQLIAVVWLQRDFDSDMIEWLFECIAGDQAFLAFQAAMALHAAVPGMARAHGTRVREAALLAISELRAAGREGSQVHRVLNVIADYIDLDHTLPHPKRKRLALIGSTPAKLARFRTLTEAALAARGFDIAPYPLLRAAAEFDRRQKDLLTCELVVLLVATSTGETPDVPGREAVDISLVELEYRTARRYDKPVLVFFHEDASHSNGSHSKDTEEMHRFRRMLFGDKYVKSFDSIFILEQSLQSVLDAYISAATTTVASGLADVHGVEEVAHQLMRCADEVHALVEGERHTGTPSETPGPSDPLLARLNRYDKTLRERADYLLAGAVHHTVTELGRSQPQLISLLTSAVQKAASIERLEEAVNLLGDLRNVADAIIAGKVGPIEIALGHLEGELKRRSDDLPPLPDVPA